jgi:hypothetical protein
MNLLTLPRYLLGDRRAILEIAGCRGALLLGGLFVLSAGFAREYDGEDLLAEPWHVLLPLAASLGTSLLLGGLLYGVAWIRTEHPLGFGTFYPSFLALYWMTAPLAWLYAVPYERFLSPADAVRANLWTLGIVSLWRVLLITRASSVLLGGRFWAVLMPVMLFADVLAIVALLFVPMPIVTFMGGIRLTESEQIIIGTVHLLRLLGCASLLIWLIGTTVIATYRRRWTPGLSPSTVEGSVSIGPWLLATGALAVWAFILPRTQPEQQLRRHTEQLLRSGRIPEALAEMSEHGRASYPMYWDPPPRIAYGDSQPPLIDVLEALPDTPANTWVRDPYLDKLVSQYHSGFDSRQMFIDPEDRTFDRQLAVLRRLPEGPRVAGEICRAMVEARFSVFTSRTGDASKFDAADWQEIARQVSDTPRERFEALLQLGGLVPAPDAEQ